MLNNVQTRVGEESAKHFFSFFIGNNESTYVLQMGIQKNRCSTDIPINNLGNISSSHAWWTPLLDCQQISVWVKMARLGQTIWLLPNLFLTGRLFRRVAFISSKITVFNKHKYSMPRYMQIYAICLCTTPVRSLGTHPHIYARTTCAHTNTYAQIPTDLQNFCHLRCKDLL